MTRTRQLQQQKKTAAALSGSLRHRRPKTKDTLEKEKRTRLLDEAIVTGNVDTLRRISVTGAGFINDGIRRRAWPLLLRTHVPRREQHVASQDIPHKDEGQVALDVIRSFTHLATDSKSRQSVKKQRQEELQQIIIDVLRRHPKLAYYQGFHDVCTCLLVVLGKEAATLAAESLALFFFRDCMLDNLEPVLNQLSLMTALLKLEDPEVQAFLDKSETLPFFPLSWVITWCAHDLNDFGKVARLFDFLLCFNPLMSIYLTTAVVMARREELLEVECDNAMVHTFLTKFPKNIDLELVISHAHQLYITYPPETLQNRAESWLDESSCVNTFSKPGTCLYDDDNEKATSTPVDFGPIDVVLSNPLVKRTKGQSALVKYPPNALQLYRRNMMTMVAFSAASMGTAALLLMNSGMFREWLSNSGLR
ncbi:MAG: rab-GTPase-TBC domain-containing protein [Podila humilis]|nr:MAG: rab-GTPase-TBC domain-containing protein [Podila humilis]